MEIKKNLNRQTITQSILDYEHPIKNLYLLLLHYGFRNFNVCITI